MEDRRWVENVSKALGDPFFKNLRDTAKFFRSAQIFNNYPNYKSWQSQKSVQNQPFEDYAPTRIEFKTHEYAPKMIARKR
jgi:hypothetical protein